MTTFLPKESFTSVAGRSPGFPVCAFRLLPDPRGDQWLMPGTRRRLRRLPVTVAGPRQILTAFPILPPPGEAADTCAVMSAGSVGRVAGFVKGFSGAVHSGALRASEDPLRDDPQEGSP